jgi:hypothetical protein
LADIHRLLAEYELSDIKPEQKASVMANTAKVLQDIQNSVRITDAQVKNLDSGTRYNNANSLNVISGTNLNYQNSKQIQRINDLFDKNPWLYNVKAFRESLLGGSLGVRLK